MTDYDTRELMSAETFLYDDIPIDLTGCAVNGPDQLTSAEQVNFPEKTSIDSDYYYPQGLPEYLDGSEENLGLTRYRVDFLS